jgi:hypothetical protein
MPDATARWWEAAREADRLAEEAMHYAAESDAWERASAARRAADEALVAVVLEWALVVVAAEEELEGEPPRGVWDALDTDPVEVLRATVRATKKSIAERIAQPPAAILAELEGT